MHEMKKNMQSKSCKWAEAATACHLPLYSKQLGQWFHCLPFTFKFNASVQRLPLSAIYMWIQSSVQRLPLSAIYLWIQCKCAEATTACHLPVNSIQVSRGYHCLPFTCELKAVGRGYHCLSFTCEFNSRGQRLPLSVINLWIKSSGQRLSLSANYL